MAERPTGHQVPTGDEGGSAPTTRPGGSPPPEPSHAERCRTLVASASRGALSTVAADPAGLPVRLGRQLRSRRSREPALLRQPHGRAHPERDPRPPGESARDRAGTRRSRPARQRAGHAAGSAVDRGRRLIVPIARDRYLEANPASAYYIDFGDFTFYRLDVQSIRYVGGYGRMSWVDASVYAEAEPDPLADSRGGNHRAHERGPRRGAGLVLPSPRRATRHHRGRHGRPSIAMASR